jgi:hypothetical protein
MVNSVSKPNIDCWVITQLIAVNRITEGTNELLKLLYKLIYTDPYAVTAHSSFYCYNYYYLQKQRHDKFYKQMPILYIGLQMKKSQLVSNFLDSQLRLTNSKTINQILILRKIFQRRKRRTAVGFRYLLLFIKKELNLRQDPQNTASFIDSFVGSAYLPPKHLGVFMQFIKNLQLGCKFDQ